MSKILGVKIIHISSKAVFLGDRIARKGLSVRFNTDEVTFDPRLGQSSAFTNQIKIEPGEVVKGAISDFVWLKKFEFKKITYISWSGNI